MREAVPPQIHMPSCCDREYPLRIVISNPFYAHNEFHFFATTVSEINL